MSVKVFWRVATVQSVILDEGQLGDLTGAWWWREAGFIFGGEGVGELQRHSVPKFPRPLFAAKGGGLGDTEELMG